MTYARLHILISVVCFISGILLPTDLSILLFSYLLFEVYHVIKIYTHCLYAWAPSPFLTHSLGVLTPWICTSRFIYILYLVDQVFREDHTLYEEPEFLYLIVSSHIFLAFLFLLFSWFYDSVHLHSVLVLFLYSSVIMCGHLYMLLQWSWFYYSRFCSLFGLLKV